MKVIAIVLALACAAYAQTTPTTACAGIAPPTNVHVRGCTTSPCPITRGSAVYADVTFTTPRAMATFSPRLFATIGGTTTEYPIGAQNGCATLSTGSCPLGAGAAVVYVFTFNVQPHHPPGDMTMRLELFDDAGIFTCFSVLVNVV